MNINGYNPIHTAAPEPVVLEKKAQHAAVASTVPKDKVAQPLDLSNTNVVVEMERNNTLVFKFIDEKTGKVIQQFPPEQMVHQNQIIPGNKQD